MARIIPLVASELGSGKCLEVGVGTGRIALPLTREGVRIFGVDISRQMLRRLLENAGGARVPVVQGDATRLPFRDATFASALAVHVLHLIPAWQDAVAELVRVLEPGGVLIVSRGTRRRVRDQGTRTDDPWDQRVTRQFFLEAGDPPWPPGVDGMQQLDDHMRGLGAAMRELPELLAERTASVDDVLSNLEAGRWAACWTIDEATRRRAAAKARAWAAEQLGDLSSPRPTVEGSVWRVYRLAQ